MREVNAILTLAYRDFLKFLRDRARLFGTLVFPLLFVGVLGGTLQANVGGGLGYSLLTFIFIGVFAQTLFQSTALGLVSLIEDRAGDFTQEIFISPISRYSIIFGKILGESAVALAQGLVILIFAAVLGVSFSPAQLLGLLPVALAACLLGGAFGVILVSAFGTQRSANQILPAIIFPQFFLAAVFTPIKVLPWYLDILSRLAPMRYAVDLARNVYYLGKPEYNAVVLESPLVNLSVMAAMFMVFLLVGTALFVRGERYR
jgi:ABC-2 type transport system permease protein